jgi:methionyl-tRNA formyltransferase
MSPFKKLRLAFLGTPDFSVPVLRALVEAGHEVAVVYSQPPKPAGRGQQVQKSPVHVAAEAMGIEVQTPRTLRDAEQQSLFVAYNLDAAVVVAYGLILPQAVLDAPRLGCLNIHFSLLPRWRGAAPVPRAMLAGDHEVGICIMQMDAGLDTGGVLAREAMPITPEITAPELLAKLTERGAALTLEALAGREAGTLQPVPQPSEGVTHAAKLSREDGRVDWTKPAAVIERQIRALQPWPGCFFMMGEEAIKLLKAEIVTDKSGAAGALLDGDFTVACGEGALRLTSLQRAGKKPTDGASFLRGARLAVGHSLLG